MKGIFAGIAAVIAVVVLGVFIVNSSKNTAIMYEESVTQAYSDVTVQEKRRADLIPNLVDCVKEYDKHEYETLMAIVNARNMNNDSDVNEVQTMIAAIAEAYPELQSSANYRELMNELATTENLIANYRASYNDKVRKYNTYVRSFPASMNLSIVGYEKVDFKKIEFENTTDAHTNLFD